MAKAEVAVNSNTSALSDGEGMGMGNKDSQMRHTKIKNNNGHVFYKKIDRYDSFPVDILTL